MNEGINRELRAAAGLFAAQVAGVSAEMRVGELGDEDDISSQIIGRIKAIAPRIPGSIVWSATAGDSKRGATVAARRLTSRGAGSEESRVGADIVLVVDIDVPGYRTKKGLFIQAKCVGRTGEAKSSTERERLVSQCEDMLGVSAASYVWAYGSETSVYSANAVLASNGFLNHVARTYPVDVFFYDFLICWIGDARIASVTRSSLEDLMAAVGADHGLALKGRARQFDADNEVSRN